MWLFIFLIIAIPMSFLSYAWWRWRIKLMHRMLFRGMQEGPETKSILKLYKENVNRTYELQNEAIERMGRGSKYRRLIAVILSHAGVYFFLLLFYWVYIVPDTSPRERHIVLICMVAIVFPLFSTIFELKRREALRKKKQKGILNRNGYD